MSDEAVRMIIRLREENAQLSKERIQARDHIRRLRGSFFLIADRYRTSDSGVYDAIVSEIEDSIQALPDLADKP